jgi:hypothetical protein
VLESVLYSAGDTVRNSSPSSPSPKLDWTDAALALSCRFNSARVSKVKTPLIGTTVGCGNPSTVFYMSFGMVVFCCCLLALLRSRGVSWRSRGNAIV